MNETSTEDLTLENKETNKNSTTTVRKTRAKTSARVTKTNVRKTAVKKEESLIVEETDVSAPKKEEIAVKEVLLNDNLTEKEALIEAKEIIETVKKGEEMEDTTNKEVLLDDNVAEKKQALVEAKEKFKEAISQSVEEELAKVENIEVISSQFTKSSDFVESMLNKLSEHLQLAEIQGRKKVEDTVDGILGDNLVNDIATMTLGYVGGKVAKGYTMGTAPAVAVSGAVKGLYKKVTD